MRIRSVKPEFWTDDVTGTVSREARLLFVGTWNVADDEGLLRWSAASLKGALFPFDDDLTVPKLERLMAELVEAKIIFPYLGGKSQQKLACIVNFHKHQRPNRPTPSKLPPPSMQRLDVREMYARRDGWICHLCLGQIDPGGFGCTPGFEPTNDHFTPISRGGSDYPSNIRAAHSTCNKGRGNRSVAEYRELLKAGKTSAQFTHPERFKQWLNAELSESLSAGIGIGNGIGAGEEQDTVLPIGKTAPSAQESSTIEKPKSYAAPVPSSAPPTEPSPSADHRTWIFREGLRFLVAESGRTEAAVRGLVGKWLRALGDDAGQVRTVIEAAIEAHVADPLGWVSAGIKARGQNGGSTRANGSSGNGHSPALAPDDPFYVSEDDQQLARMFGGIATDTLLFKRTGAWSTTLHGPPPNDAATKVPPAVLSRHGYAEAVIYEKWKAGLTG